MFVRYDEKSNGSVQHSCANSRGKRGVRMTNTAIRRTTSALVAALFVAVGSAVSMAPAHADPPNDQQFIDFLDKKGVPYQNKTDVIRTAKQFCLDYSRQGGSTWKVGYKLMKAEGWTESQAMNFVQAAVPVYCPSA
jgi:hypothetical protein